MIVEKSIEKTTDLVGRWQREGMSICLVPTMGFFHEGHLSLMRKGKEVADKVIVSLFVNPTQFGAGEDLDKYPNDLHGDLEKAEAQGVDLVFCPDNERMYGAGYQTYVEVKELSKDHCGKDRPVHFRGVATVVTKLFNIINPEYVIFGEKDFQQLTIIKRMVKDLNFPVEVIGHPIVREHDGLAMSSRNAYLKGEERTIALTLYNALKTIKESLNRSPDVELQKVVEAAKESIIRHEQCTVDYITIVDSESLEEIDILKDNCRVLGAIKINNRVRLIDNMRIS